MLGSRLRALRQARGMTQAALAARAGVSRQLVGAVEQGRHLPRVDAALALAAALDVTVEQLVGPPATEATSAAGVLGALPARGTPVRVGRVGERLVCAPTSAGAWDGWERTDAVVGRHGPDLHDDARPGVVAVGCDPALGLAARLAGDADAPVLAVNASTAAAIEALVDGRAHACLVHGVTPADPPPDVQRWHLARWQAGIAAPADAPDSWADDALQGRVEVVQRAPGAGSQAAFERAAAATGATPPGGPIVAGHLEAAWLATRTGLPAVTIEPAARAAGLRFHPLEAHAVQLWVTARFVDEPGVRRLGEALTSSALARRLAAIGGYDLEGCGTPLATVGAP